MSRTVAVVKEFLSVAKITQIRATNHDASGEGALWQVSTTHSRVVELLDDDIAVRLGECRYGCTLALVAVFVRRGVSAGPVP